MFVSYLNFWLTLPRNGLSLISSWEATDCKEPPSWSARFDKLQAEYTLLWRNKQMRLIKMPFSLGQKKNFQIELLPARVKVLGTRGSLGGLLEFKIWWKNPQNGKNRVTFDQMLHKRVKLINFLSAAAQKSASKLFRWVRPDKTVVKIKLYS